MAKLIELLLVLLEVTSLLSWGLLGGWHSAAGLGRSSFSGED